MDERRRRLRIKIGKTAVGWILVSLGGFAAGSLAACSASASSPEGDAGTSVTVVQLSDGTRCAVMDKRGNGGVAIDCDWP